MVWLRRTVKRYENVGSEKTAHYQALTKTFSRTSATRETRKLPSNGRCAPEATE